MSQGASEHCGKVSEVRLVNVDVEVSVDVKASQAYLKKVTFLFSGTGA